MDMILVDWFSLTIISAFAVGGFFSGFTKEVFSTSAWVISLIAAWFFGPLFFPFIESYINNPEVKSVIAFFGLFIILFTLIKLSGKLVSSFLSALGLGFFDKIVGFIFGGAKGIAILVSAYILTFNSLEQQSWWVDSISKEWTIKIAEVMEPLIEDWKTQAETLLDKEHVTFPPSL